MAMGDLVVEPDGDVSSLAAVIFFILVSGDIFLEGNLVLFRQ